MKTLMRNALLLTGFLILTMTGCAHHKAEPALNVEEDSLNMSSDGAATETPSLIEDESDDDVSLDEFEGEFEEKSVHVADPLYPLNYVMFQVYDKLYFWFLKPVAKGYKFVVPDLARTGIKNFFRNLKTPVRLTSCLLQGKGKSAGHEVLGFLVNSTVGVLGFGDPAQNNFNLKLSDEDLGQAFGSWGIGNGIYIVWPIFGPSTLRDTIGLAGDTLLDPLNYVSDPAVGYGAGLIQIVNATSFRLGDYEAIKNSAVKPYEAFRNAYIQYRQAKVDD